MPLIELWRRGAKQHFKGLSDHLEKCQFTTYRVLCPNRRCHHCTPMLTSNRQFTAAAHASAHLNAQKLNRSSSSKNLRILRQTKKGPLRASNVCNKYLTNESLEAAFSFLFLLLLRRTAAAQSSRNKAVLDYELGKMALLRQA